VLDDTVQRAFPVQQCTQLSMDVTHKN
jgi:hypothetical protein